MSNISQKLDIGQSQQLVMTPQLQQAIKLLQLNNIELSEFLEEELEKNPLLEKLDSNQIQEQPAPPLENEVKDDVDAAFESAQNVDFDSGSYMADMGSGGNSKFDSSDENIEERTCSEKSLREHLTEQLNMSFSDDKDRMIGAFLIDRLDESGYLRDDEKELSERLGCSKGRISRLLKCMKQFDPTGVFSKDLSECLALQLEERGQMDKQMAVLLDNLHLIAEHDFKKLTDLCGVNDTYLKDMIEEIKSLNPKPIADFEHFVVQSAIPDVLMKKMPKNLGGGWRVELNSETLPRVLVNNDYYTQVSNKSMQKGDREYVTSQLASANWLVKAMDQRAQTILKTASEIVEQQDAFFNYGVEFLKPLTLKDIAEEIGMHESTVSRVTANKYIGTPRGIFELKFFFSTGLVSQSGQIHSSEAIKARIKSLIDNEDVNRILSDDKIVDILKAEGIDIARRTVAKYRDVLHIGSSVQRRKQKKNLANQ